VKGLLKKMNIEPWSPLAPPKAGKHRTSNTRPPRLNETTKGRRALSMARDGGQERHHYSTFDVLMFDVGRSSFKTISYGINTTFERLQNNLS